MLNKRKPGCSVEMTRPSASNSGASMPSCRSRAGLLKKVATPLYPALFGRIPDHIVAGKIALLICQLLRTSFDFLQAQNVWLFVPKPNQGVLLKAARRPLIFHVMIFIDYIAMFPRMASLMVNFTQDNTNECTNSNVFYVLKTNLK